MPGMRRKVTFIKLKIFRNERRRNWADNLSEFICSSFIVCLYFLVEY